MFIYFILFYFFGGEKFKLLDHSIIFSSTSGYFLIISCVLLGNNYAIIWSSLFKLYLTNPECSSIKENMFWLILDRLSYLRNPSARAGYDTRLIFKRSLTGLNSEFSFSKTSSLTKAAEPSMPYYLTIAGGRIIGFIPFPRVLVLCEMQSVSSRIWTPFPTTINITPQHLTVYLLLNEITKFNIL